MSDAIYVGTLKGDVFLEEWDHENETMRMSAWGKNTKKRWHF